jgi:hypothetical protein
MSENIFLRSPHRDAIVELLTTAPADGVPVTAIMQIPGVGSRDNADHLLMRMVKAGEVIRVARGRYGPLRRRARALPPVPRDVAPISAPAANNGGSHGAKDANGSHQRQVAPKPAPRIAADPGVSLRNELARELFERRLGIEDDPVEAPRAAISFETFVATIAGKYVQAGLCPPPPSRLRGLASSWIAAGITVEHILAHVERHLREHAAGCQSGSGDRLLPHLNDVIRHTWKDRGATGPAKRQVLTRPSPRELVDDWEQYTGRTKRIGDDTDGNFGGM